MFAAHTLNYCLGFEVGADPEYTYSDLEAIEAQETLDNWESFGNSSMDEEQEGAQFEEEPREARYPQDAQVALNRGWVTLIEGAFSPDTAVTHAEAQRMFADVQNILPTTEIDENHVNVYEFADGVIVIPDGTSVYVDEDGTVTVYDCPVTIKSGDVFAFYQDGIPQIYEAVTVTGDASETVITTQETDEDAAITDMDASGVADGDLNQAVAAEGVDITYIEGGTEEAQFQDGTMYYSAREAATKNINAVNYSAEFPIGSTGITTKVTCTLTNLKLEYDVQKKNHYTYVACKGKAIVTGSVSADLMKAMNAPDYCTLGYISVGGVGYISVQAVIGVDGKVTVTYGTNFFAGMSYSDSSGFRIVKDFKKDRFDLVTEVEVKLGIKATAGFRVPCVNGSVYAEFGGRGQYKRVTWNDGEAPAVCCTFRGWLYAKAGVSLTIDYLIDEKKFSRDIVIFDFDNSPVRLVYHWEDSIRKQSCSRQPGDSWYLSGFNSKYGSPGDGYMWGEGGTFVPVFTYELSKDEYNNDVATITGYTGSAYALAIPEEVDGYKVVAVGEGAFEKRADLCVVTIPDSVTRIETRAFARCTSLQQVIMGNGVTEVGAWAFEFCSSLVSVQLSNSVTKICGGAFAECDSLQNIRIPKSLKETTEEYDPAVHYGYAYGVFMESDGLKNVTFEEGITAIPAGLFGYCNGLESITIPDTVQTIGGSAFNHCENLRDVAIPDSVSKIDNGAFYGCAALSSVQIPDSVTEIGAWAFAVCDSLSDVKLSRSVTKIGGGAFAKCDSLTSIEIPKSLTETTEEYDPGIHYGYAYGVFMESTALKNVIFEAGTKEIARGLFGYCRGLESIVIPDTVTTIEASAFDHCDNLKDVTIPGSVTLIDDGAFSNCISIKELVIPDSVTEIGAFAFAQCTSLSSLKLSNSIRKICGGAFGKCDSLETVTIPKSLKEVSSEYNPGIHYGYSNGIFVEGQGPKTIIFEDGMTEIPNGILEYTRGVTKVEIPASVKKINNNAFAYCDSLREISLPVGVALGDWTLRKCTSLEQIVIPEGITSMGTAVLAECTALQTVTLPEGIESIPNETFYGCGSLNTIDIPESVTRIGASAFENSGLISIELPGAVATVENKAFKNSSSLTEAVLPDSVMSLGNEAFRGCVALGRIMLGENLQSIGNYAFYSCDALTAITIPNSVTSLGSYCFAESDALTDVKLSSGITTIPSYAFNQCAALQKLILPYSVTTVNEYAFANCTGFTEITIPRATTSIAGTAFSYPQNMTVYGVAGSYAETYAEAHGMTFVANTQTATSASLDRTELTLNKGASARLILNVEPENFTDAVAWRTKDTDIISVDSSGVVKALAVGSAAVDVNVGTQKLSCAVTVVQPVTSIYLNQYEVELDALEMCQLNAEVRPDNAANPALEWSTSDEAVATVNDSGLVTALAKGSAVITVKSTDGSNISRTCRVTVKNTAHIAASVEDMQSDHPYANNCSDFWIYTAAEDADALRVTFDELTEIEDYDDLHIYGIDGTTETEIEGSPYTRDSLAGQTVVVPGNTVKIQLFSDAWGNMYGFKVTSIWPDVPKQPQTVTGTTAYEKKATDDPFALDAVASGGGTLSYRSDNEEVAQVSDAGLVTIVGAGSAVITATAAETETYSSGSLEISVVVEKAQQQALVIEGIPEVLTYGDSAFTLSSSGGSTDGEVIYQAAENNDVLFISGSTVTIIGAGSAQVKAVKDGDARYEAVEAYATVNVSPKALTDAMVEITDGDCRFTGAAVLPDITVKDRDTVLALETDYTVTGSNNEKVASANSENPPVVTIEGKGNYTGSVQKAFTILKGIQDVEGQMEHVELAGTNGSAEVDIAALLPEKRGTTTYTVTQKDADGILQSVTVSETGTLSYQVSASAARRSAQITVTAVSENYDPIEVVIEVVQECSHSDQTKWEVRGAKAKTCTEAGYTGDTWCLICKVLVKQGTQIAAGHEWNTDYTVDQVATEAAPGSKSIHCNVCGEIKPGSQVAIPQLASSQPANPDPAAPTIPVSPAVGVTVADAATGAAYRITTAGASGVATVEYVKPVNAKKTSVTVPDTVVVNGASCRVTSIAANAFKNNKYLKKVTIGSNILTIGSNAFYNCKKLKTVGGGANISEIGTKAFAKCPALAKITIPATVTRIGKQAFYNCAKLKNITIKTVSLTSKTVGAKAFKGTSAKASVKVPKSKLKTYAKLLKAKGLSSKSKIKK